MDKTLKEALKLLAPTINNTVRDQFAAAALTGMLTRGHYDSADALASIAYQKADAMMKERKHWLKLKE